MASKDRSAGRQQRRSQKRPNHEPLLRLTQQEITRKPVKAANVILRPLTDAQRHYDACIHANSITFGIGPAGTGKTWWAAMRAAEALKNGDIERIIVTRPAVEAGENLGFLPGELDEKYEPYFRPVRDALEESLGSGHLEYCLKAKVIEARPLALLRGATLKHAWVIADEMQNATINQMKMFLTRIGENARFIVNGDPNQCDLPSNVTSGLMDAVRRLQGKKDIGFITFTKDDIVRHGLCQVIVEAYETPANSLDASSYNEDSEGLRRTIRVA